MQKQRWEFFIEAYLLPKVGMPKSLHYEIILGAPL